MERRCVNKACCGVFKGRVVTSCIPCKKRYCGCDTRVGDVDSIYEIL